MVEVRLSARNPAQPQNMTVNQPQNMTVNPSAPASFAISRAARPIASSLAMAELANEIAAALGRLLSPEDEDAESTLPVGSHRRGRVDLKATWWLRSTEASRVSETESYQMILKAVRQGAAEVLACDPNPISSRFRPFQDMTTILEQS